MTITFYATIDADSVRPYIPPVPVLLPASSFARYMSRDGRIRVPRLPEHVIERAADCGGFVATRVWGDYRYSPEQYVAWLRAWNPRWAASFDYCCENEITTGNVGVVRERQDRTTKMAWHFWRTYRSTSWTWVPTIQGWHEHEYRRHARDMRPLVGEMREHYGPELGWRIAIGTLCQRANSTMVHRVVQVVRRELPGVPIHLWGVKLGVLSRRPALPECVVSVDSAAWHGLFGRGREEWRRSGLSQRRYTLTVALPRYIRKVDQALQDTGRAERNQRPNGGARKTTPR